MEEGINVYRFEMTLKNHMLNSWIILSYVIILPLLPLYMEYQYGNEDKSLQYIISFGGLAMVMLPQLAIHLNYYLLNRGMVLIFNATQRTFSIQHRGLMETFNVDDIARVEKHVSFPLSRDSRRVLPWDEYNHSYLYLENGDSYVITSLLVPNFNIPVPSDKIVIRRNFYRLARAPKRPFIKETCKTRDTY